MRKFDVQQLVDLVDRQLGVDPDRLLVYRFDQRLLLVVLVNDLADDLLDQVLDRHEAGGAAVLVHHDRHMHVLLLHLPQQLRNLLLLGNEEGGTAQRTCLYIAPRLVDALEQVLRVQHTHDVVDIALIDRDARVTALDDYLQGLVQRRDGPGGHHVGTRDHHLAYERVSELEDRVDQLTLVLFDLVLVTVLLVVLLTEIADLLLGNEGSLADGATRKRADERIGDGDHHASQRTESDPQDVHGSGNKESNGFGVLDGEGAGSDLGHHVQEDRHGGDRDRFGSDTEVIDGPRRGEDYARDASQQRE